MRMIKISKVRGSGNVEEMRERNKEIESKELLIKRNKRVSKREKEREKEKLR